MTKPLSYLSLKCVVEYLEANKRFLISDRSSLFDELERQVPLCLDYFCSWYNAITINATTYRMHSVERRVLKNPNRKGDYIDIPENYDQSSDNGMVPGDLICFYIQRDKVPYDNYWGNNPTKQPIYEILRPSPNDPLYHNYEYANKKARTRFIDTFFKTRRNILVKRLVLITDTNIQLPPCLKLQVQDLEANTSVLEYNMYGILNLISGNQKILKIKESNWNDKCFDLPLVQIAKKLIIFGDYDLWAEWNRTLLNLPNREITFECHKCPNFGKTEMTSFVQGLLNEGREIGTSYTFIRESNRSMLKIMEKIGKQYKSNMQKKWKNRLSISKYSVSYSMHLPMNSTSELFIHGTNTRFENRTTMEVVPITPLKLTDFDRLVARVSSGFSRILGR